jgi:hypothetical protein
VAAVAKAQVRLRNNVTFEQCYDIWNLQLWKVRALLLCRCDSSCKHAS